MSLFHFDAPVSPVLFLESSRTATVSSLLPALPSHAARGGEFVPLPPLEDEDTLSELDWSNVHYQHSRSQATPAPGSPSSSECSSEVSPPVRHQRDYTASSGAAVSNVPFPGQGQHHDHGLVHDHSHGYGNGHGHDDGPGHSLESAGPDSSSSLPSLSDVLSLANSFSVPSLASMSAAALDGSSGRRGSKRSAPGSSSASRAEAKKLKHREIDAVRRQREAAVIARLQELNARHHTVCADVQGVDDSPAADKDRGKDKVSILEDSADKMHAMQQLCQKLTETCTAQQRSIEQLTAHVTALAKKIEIQADMKTLNNKQSASAAPRHSDETSPSALFTSAVTAADSSSSTPAYSSSLAIGSLPSASQEYLAQMDRSFSLYSSCFLQASICVMLISVKTGRLLDANACFYRSSGWTPEQILGRIITAPAEFILGTRDSRGMTDIEKLVDEQCRPLVRRNGTLVPARRLHQYPRSKQKFKELILGQTDQIHAVWRSELADGHTYEISNVSYTGKREMVDDGHGKLTLQPVHVVFACSVNDGIRLT